MTSTPEQTATVESTRLPTADDVVLGVDTHKDEHVAAVVTTLGLLVATASFPATAAGYEELPARAGKFGVVRRAGVEGTGSYEAAQARHLRSCGVTVIGVNRPDRSMRRHRGSSLHSHPRRLRWPWTAPVLRLNHKESGQRLAACRARGSDSASGERLE
ncbi:transposase [Streptomyces sp. NPDC059590]|uniref:IS110 family transposase n=1 Tax=Streptomyces sp. NPDC059590 TaxID=3346877 RepID=UPI0036913C15